LIWPRPAPAGRRLRLPKCALTKVDAENIIFIVTRNQGKLREIEDLLRGEGYLFFSLEDFPQIPSPPETGQTLEENARIKALQGARATGYVALGEDSSLEIDVLGGRPGIESARFLGERASDEDRNRQILEWMKGYKGEERKARFRCVVAIAQGDRILGTATGTCEGLIAEVPRGKGGFGFDPIFLLPDYGKTLAELGPRLKNRVSHRGMALRKAREILRRSLSASQRAERDP